MIVCIHFIFSIILCILCQNSLNCSILLWLSTLLYDDSHYLACALHSHKLSIHFETKFLNDKNVYSTGSHTLVTMYLFSELDTSKTTKLKIRRSSNFWKNMINVTLTVPIPDLQKTGRKWMRWFPVTNFSPFADDAAVEILKTCCIKSGRAWVTTEVNLRNMLLNKLCLRKSQYLPLCSYCCNITIFYYMYHMKRGESLKQLSLNWTIITDTVILSIYCNSQQLMVTYEPHHTNYSVIIT